MDKASRLAMMKEIDTERTVLLNYLRRLGTDVIKEIVTQMSPDAVGVQINYDDDSLEDVYMAGYMDILTQEAVDDPLGTTCFSYYLPTEDAEWVAEIMEILQLCDWDCVAEGDQETTERILWGGDKNANNNQEL